MSECKKNVGRGVVSYPCNLEPNHDGPCVARENQPSIRARAAWEKAIEEGEAELAQQAVPTLDEVVAQRPLPHPGAEPLSSFQGPPRNSQAGLMEYAQPGHAAPLATTDTNRPGEAKILYTKQPDGTFVPSHVRSDSVEIDLPKIDLPPQTSRAVATVTVSDKAVPVPTKQREGDQPLPVANDTVFVQDLVIEDIEALKKVGIQRYGSALQAFNGRNVDQDLYEELVDATMYLRQALIERAELRELFESLVANIEVTLGDIPFTWQGSIEKIRSGL